MIEPGLASRFKLVGNAIDHGAPDQPIQVTAAMYYGWFEFSVTNAGEQIPPRYLTISSTPMTRAQWLNRQGLGLGLHISNEIPRRPAVRSV